MTMQQPNNKEPEKFSLSVNEKVVLIMAKQRVEKVLRGLNKLAQKGKITKEGRRILKLMNEFMRCNLTSPSIKTKYDNIMQILEKYKNPDNTENK